MDAGRGGCSSAGTDSGGQTSARARFTNHLEFQLEFDSWYERVNGLVRRSLRAVPAGQLAEKRGEMWLAARSATGSGSAAKASTLAQAPTG